MGIKSFTLVELIIVVIIISILAVISMAQFVKVVERARVGSGKVMLGMIVQANKLNSAQTSSYASDIAVLQGYIEVVDSDTDWSYTASAVDGSATAMRSGGDQVGRTITLSQTGTWAGDHPMK